MAQLDARGILREHGQNPQVAIIMGSKSDWPTLQHAADMLERFDVAYQARVVSAHRTPDRMRDFATQAEADGLQVIIAAAGGAAHLPGMVAAMTTVPVLGVPIRSKTLNGVDSLLSIVQMPKGVPVGTLAIGDAGAANAALFAVGMLANHDSALRKALTDFRAEQAAAALEVDNG